MSQRNKKFRIWEWALLGSSILMVTGAAGAYFSGFSVLRYLLGVQVDGEALVPVGRVVAVKGALRRQSRVDSGFAEAKVETVLYDGDTLISAESASLVLDSGGTLELGAGTMIRLSFEQGIALGGVSRLASVDVVKGAVEGKAGATGNQLRIRSEGKDVSLNAGETHAVTLAAVPILKPVAKAPVKVLSSTQLGGSQISAAAAIVATRSSPTPTPIPSPTPLSSPSPRVMPSPSVSPSPSPSPLALNLMQNRLKILAPKPGAQAEPESRNGALVTVLAELLGPAPARAIDVDVRLIGKGGQLIGTPVRTQFAAEPDPKIKVEVPVSAPGSYSLQVKAGTLQAQVAVTVRPEFPAIRTRPMKVGGLETGSSQLSGKLVENFDVTLEWEPYSGVEEYQVTVYRDPAGLKPVLQRKVRGTSFVFNRNQVISGELFYRVSASALASGFVPASALQRFNFSFVAPLPTLPADGEKYSLAELKKGGGTILLTWQKTNFTEGYDLEIVRPAGGARQPQTLALVDNFYAIPIETEGQYFWRVRSRSKGVASPFSAPRKLFVGP